ncbi:MAG: M48 family metallopeptidase, partial [Terriglobia bacterium]
SRNCIGRLKSIAILVALLAPALAFAVEELNFKPGFNFYSPQQDVQLGKANADGIQKQLPMLNDPETMNYITSLGRKLSRYAPNDLKVYVWDFHVVNTADINAFALPGGYIFVNRGTITAAENEAELAGVIAHEEGHVVMRHGTHQASEMSLVKAPLSILGAILGASSSTAGSLIQAGLGFGVNSIFLKNSRGIESQADAVGTYILYHAGYDPHAMAQFFEMLQKKYPQQTIQFFSDHPNPGNRVKNVNQEIPTLGPARANWITDTPQFESAKRHLMSLPPPLKPRPQP